MSKSNFRNNNFFKSKVTNIVANASDSTFSISLKIELNKFNNNNDEEWHVIFRNSTNIIAFFSQQNKNIQIKELVYYNTGVSNPVEKQNIFAQIETFNFDNLESNHYFNITVKWKPSSTEYSSLSSDLNFNSSANSTLTFSKIGALKNLNNSGVINKSYNKIKKENNSEIGTLPASKITNGSILTNFNDPYKELNLIEFSEKNNVNVSIGLPLKQTNIQDKFYLTTNNAILNDSNALNTSDTRFVSEFDLDNTRVFSTPNKIDSLSNQIKTTKSISVDNLNHVIKQNRFEEEFKPFEESSYFFEEESTRSDFYNNTLVFDDNSKFSLSEQKQIKITLDFSSDFDLHLMNTKFSFIYPDASNNKSNFQSSNNKDKIYDTKYFNFLQGSTADSYSSHFMPTAYWNFTNNRWNYLDSQDDDFSGIKISNGTNIQLPNNFVFEANGDLSQSSIHEDHLRDFNYFHMTKPILTTPGFRNSGSLIKTRVGEQYNKSMLSQITDTYGFPYRPHWQPSDDNLIDMSNYLAKDFLLEKMVIKGKFTSKAEMPLKKGNYSSGYSQSSNSISSLSSFNQNYEMKSFDSSQLYLSNAVTFFLLNERKNENYFDQKLETDSLQHYTTLLTDSLTNSPDKSFGKDLKTYSGEFETSSSDLKVSNYFIENNQLYSFDGFNNLTTEVKGGSNTLGEFKQNFMHYLASASSSNSSLRENLYYKSRNSWDNSNFNEDLINNNNIIAKIKKEGNAIVHDETKSRDLITYSNLLVTKRSSALSYEFDEEVLKNIDNHYIISENQVNNINVDTPQEFVIKSICKNNATSSDYLDESEYKLKSNFYKNITSQASVDNEFAIKNVTESSLSDLSLFSYSPTPYEQVNSILGYNLYSNMVPQQINKFTLRLRKKSDNSKSDFIRFIFEFDNPNTVNGSSGTYDAYSSWSNDTGVYLKDFIEYSSNTSLNTITINLRILDMWSNKSILSHFLSINKVSSEDSNNITEYSYGDIASTKLNVATGTWNDFTKKEQSTAISLLIAYALFFKKDIQGSSNLDSPFDNSLISLDSVFSNTTTKQVLIKSYNNDTSFFVKESRENTFTFLDENNNVLFTHLNDGTSTDFEISDLTIGNDLVTSQVDYYQENYILEGKVKGSNNLNIDTSRVINKKPITLNAIQKFKTKSGKYTQEGDGFNSGINSNYLIKPTDKLIFGVSSNCNGQVMPTVFKLHDKIEITLIGRDFIDNSLEYKNNLSKSIRKVVLGDDFVSKVNNTIYQTKDSYYDNIWNKNNKNNSLNDFKSGKVIIGKKSSRDFGTYSGITTLSNETQIQNNNKFNIYKKDTINPSLGKVFSSHYNLKTVVSKNNKNDDVLKIILSENDSVSTTQNVINKWHSNFHLADASNTSNDQKSDFFYNINNCYIEDNTFSNIENNNNFNLEVCYDIDSYSPSPNFAEYENIANSTKTSKYSNASLDNVKRHGKTLKSFALPNTCLFSYQNGLQIQNEEVTFVYSENQKKFIKHLKSNVFLENSNKNTKVSVNKFTASLQYFDPILNINYHTNNYEPLKKRDVLKEYINDDNNFADDGALAFNPQWNIVIEMSLGNFNAFIGKTLTISQVSSIDYFGKTMHVFLYEDNQNSTKGISKTARIIKVDTSENIVTIAIPLYFWETLEVDDSFLTNNNFLNYGKIEQKSNSFNSNNPAWYATLNDNTKIINNQNIYKIFTNTSVHNSITSSYSSNGNKSYPLIQEITSSYENNNGSNPPTQNYQTLPHTTSNLLTNTTLLSFDSDKLVLDTFFISLSSFQTIVGDINPIYSDQHSSFENANNFYKTNFHKRYLTHEKYFERSEDDLEKRSTNELKVSDEDDNFYLNEKIYRSKIYKKKENDFVVTNSYLVYKVHKLYINETGITNTAENPLNEYNVIEIIASDTDYCLFEKNLIDKENLLFDFNENDTIRIYEDQLKKFDYFGSDTPYFEIDLSSKTKGFTGETNGIVQILYSHLKINSSSIDISTNLNNNNNIKSGHLGSPIFLINSESNSLYKSFNSQEDAIKNFFYGFSRGEYRYPIRNIDGFKYGVENGSPQSYQYHFSNKRYGQVFDKVNGTLNSATLKQDSVSQTNIVTYTTQKRFVNSKTFKRIDSSSTTNTYNKDLYSRSSHPYIEDSGNQLSQYYVAS